MHPLVRSRPVITESRTWEDCGSFAAYLCFLGDLIWSDYEKFVAGSEQKKFFLPQKLPH